jgi:hypothetical protein
LTWSILAILVAFGGRSPRARAADAEPEPPLFYKPLTYGSESQFNPISSFINYAIDPIQIPESFDDNHFASRAETVGKDLTDPFSAINRSGGFRQFVNGQLFPVDFDHLDDSLQIIPNYALHALGGGMVYRKNAEWLALHGYPYPRILAGTLAMASEFVHEVMEKKSTEPDDPIGDFYFMRPLGIALFSWEPFARFAAERLRMAEWPYQPMFNPREGEFMNVGENWVVRPALFGTEKHKPFVFFGLTTLVGASHQLTEKDSFSWGIGPAIRKADPHDVQYRWSGGFFWDRNDSLLASLMINGTENLAARLNVYPGALIRSRWLPGIFLGIGDHRDVSIGLTWRFLPLGISDTIK